MPEGVDIHPDALPIEALRDRAWHAIEPHYLARLAGLVEMFRAARSKSLAPTIWRRAPRMPPPQGGSERCSSKRIAHIPGRIDAVTGGIEFDDLADPEVDDLLDDVGELVLENGGQVATRAHRADAVPADGNCCHLSILSRTQAFAAPCTAGS